MVAINNSQNYLLASLTISVKTLDGLRSRNLKDDSPDWPSGPFPELSFEGEDADEDEDEDGDDAFTWQDLFFTTILPSLLSIMRDSRNPRTCIKGDFIFHLSASPSFAEVVAVAEVARVGVARVGVEGGLVNFDFPLPCRFLRKSCRPDAGVSHLSLFR